MNSQTAGASAALFPNSLPSLRLARGSAPGGPAWRRFLKKTPAVLLLACLLLAPGTARGAAVSGGGSLQNAVNNTGAGSAITFTVDGITFPAGGPAVNITGARQNMTITGRVSGNFSSRIANAASSLLKWAGKNETAATATLAGRAQNTVAAFLSSLPANLTFINGGGGTRGIARQTT